MKTTFSELLSGILSQSEISKNEMIRVCDIDRSSFFKFLRGNRIPTVEQLNTICNKLQFSPGEEKALRLEYARITQGEDAVKARNRIVSLLWKLEETDDVRSLTEAELHKAVEDMDCGAVVEGKDNVFRLLKNTIVWEANRRTYGREVDMFLPSRVEELFKWLLAFISSDIGKHVKIQHLIELPSRNTEADQMITDRLRFALLCSTVNDDVYMGHYYYSNDPISDCVGAFYPFFMITETRVILMNERMNKAIILSDPKCCSDYRSSFMTALNDARPIIRKADPADLSMELNGPIRYLYGNREAAEKAFKGESVVYISLSGIKEYLDSDMFQETGSGTNKGDRDGLKEKIRILKEAKKKLGSTVYLIDERNIPPARTWFVALSGKEKLILCRRDNAHIFIVTESGIVDAFNSFMEELPNSGNLLRTDLAMEQIDRLLAEAE